MAQMRIKLVLTTVDSDAASAQLCRDLVERKLVACVTAIPSVSSVYIWKGTMEASSEILLLLKTTADQIQPLKEYLKTAHPYDVPECLVFDVEDGLEDYLNWVHQQTR